MNGIQNNKKLFGTDGIRGVANVFPMTPELSLKLGKALVHTIREKDYQQKGLKVVVGKDTRLSGYMFEQAITSGLASMGADILLVGPLPTPAIAFITKSMGADAGIVISASHNLYEDNGIKVFDRDGFKLPDEEELVIEEMILSDEVDSLGVSSTDIGKAYRIDDALGQYVVYVKNTFPSNYSLDGLKIVLDCANGAGYRAAPIVFNELGAEVIAHGHEPDGRNINHQCGALYPDRLRALVVENGADLGIALDGDADRVIFCDEKGKIVDGDKIMAVCAEELLRAGRLSKNTVVATIMSNMALERFMSDMGATLIRVGVGDRYVVEKMRSGGYNFGGEKSGHIIFLDHSTTGDGVLAALQILSIMIKRDKPLSELANIIDLFPQRVKSVRVAEKAPFEDIPMLSSLIQSSEKKMGDDGRINLRYSGTEPVARVMVEGSDEDLITEITNEIAELINDQIGE